MRSLGAMTPPRSLAKPRSRSVPIALGAVSEAAVTGPVSFLEAFDGFYKQLVLGTKCTGPDALAVNERFVEIDLSAEFPPERREAQVDFLAPQVPHAAFERSACGHSPHTDTCNSSPCHSVHHL